MRRFLIGLAAVLASGVVASCGSDSDDNQEKEDSCFWECDVGSTGTSRACVSYAGVTAAKCQQMAEDSCTAPVLNVQHQPGCSCPSFGKAGECESAPAWYWGNACFFQCAGKSPSCEELGVQTEADCQKEAQDSCAGSADAGSAPEHVELQMGCSCPTFGDVGECTTPPAWYQ